MIASNRKPKREVAWEEMKLLEDAGLGHREVVSHLRDKFMLHVDHPKADRLTSRPEANGFIRADEDTLLFRDASSELRASLPEELIDQSTAHSEKGLEFRWTQIDESDVRRLFEAVRDLSA